EFACEKIVRRCTEGRFHLHPFLFGEPFNVIKPTAADDADSIILHARYGGKKACAKQAEFPLKAERCFNHRPDFSFAASPYHFEMTFQQIRKSAFVLGLALVLTLSSVSCATDALLAKHLSHAPSVSDPGFEEALHEL